MTTTWEAASMLSVAASPSMLKRPSTDMDSSAAPSKRQRILQYACQWEDCQTAFHSAARLEEHRRSHTGEKPFKCTHPGCTSAFSRSHHLSAHQGVHASSSTPHAQAQNGTPSASSEPVERKHTCSAEACAARFAEGWRRKRHEETCDVLRAERGLLGQETEAEATALESEGVDGENDAVVGNASSEMRKRKRGGHQERAERMYACSEAQCDASFRKRKHLRAHIWAAHSAQPELSPFVRSAAATPAPGSAAASSSPSTSVLPLAPLTTAVAKPFPCAHPGCACSFTTAALRRTHARKHKTQRYVCTMSHPDGSSTATFPTWSALQQHMKQAHPPTCEQCGKTFKRNENLRAHSARHEERAAAEHAALRHNLHAGDAEGDGIDVDGESTMGEEQQAKLEGRTFMCNWSPAAPAEGEEATCTKRFKSAYARDTHIKVAHKKERNFKCSCGKAYGHKHLLRAHVRKAGDGHVDAAEVAAAAVVAAQGSSSREEEVDDAASSDEAAASDSDDFYRAEGGAVPESHASRPAAPVRRRTTKPSVSLAALLTGAGYATSTDIVAVPAEGSSASAASKRRIRGRVLGCPWSMICELRDAQPVSADSTPSLHIEDGDDGDDDDGAEDLPSKTRCDYRFSRLYDVRRHLASAHDLEMSDAQIKALLPNSETKGLPKPRRSATPAARA